MSTDKECADCTNPVHDAVHQRCAACQTEILQRSGEPSGPVIQLSSGKILRQQCPAIVRENGHDVDCPWPVWCRPGSLKSRVSAMNMFCWSHAKMYTNSDKALKRDDSLNRFYSWWVAPRVAFLYESTGGWHRYVNLVTPPYKGKKFVWHKNKMEFRDLTGQGTGSHIPVGTDGASVPEPSASASGHPPPTSSSTLRYILQDPTQRNSTAGPPSPGHTQYSGGLRHPASQHIPR